MVYTTVILLFGASVEAARFQADAIPPFATFLQTYQRSYKANSTEYKQREDLYNARAAVANKHNQQAQKLWFAGVNKLWDWTDAELQGLRGRRGHSSMTHGGGGGKLAAVRRYDFLSKNHTVLGNSTAGTLQSLPLSGDWTHLQIGKRVPDQGSCGSCWAIAASTTLEGNYEIHTSGKSRTFAVQEMVDCIPNPRECGGQGGCRGATLELAMDWVLKHGCNQEHETPYQAKDTTCAKTVLTSSPQQGQAFGMLGWEKLKENSYDNLILAMQDGPVGVSVAASSWFSYSSGIFDGCGKDAIIDHAVTMVAYGADNNVKYWKIQNSWGAFWGEQGYMRLLRSPDDSTNWCGIDNKPELGTGCKGGPPEVTVCGMCGILYDSVIPHFG